MKDIIEYFRRLFAQSKPAETDETCPYCHGLGYDATGWTCTCLREKK
jgi:hypothetical protein